MHERELKENIINNQKTIDEASQCLADILVAIIDGNQVNIDIDNSTKHIYEKIK